MSYSEFLESYQSFRKSYDLFLKSWRAYQTAIRSADKPGKKRK